MEAALGGPSGHVVAEAGVGGFRQFPDQVPGVAFDAFAEAGDCQGDGQRALDGAGARHVAAAAGPALGLTAGVVESSLKGGVAAAEGSRGTGAGGGGAGGA